MSYTSSTLTITQDVTAAETKQLVDILTPILFGPSRHNRKDSYLLKFDIDTGGDDVQVLVYVSHQTDPISVGPINRNGLTQSFLDISDKCGITRTWQVRFVGLVSRFKLSRLEIDYNPRPEPSSFYRHLLAPTGPQKKRIRVWPFTIDTDGTDVSVIPYVDNVAQPLMLVTSTYPETFLYQFKTDVFGTDYAMTMHGCCDFELYGVHDPIGVETLPIGKQFDQLGSEDLFRYGKVKTLLIRLLPIGGTSIPVTIYFADTTSYSSTLTVVDGKEDTYEFKVPKTVAGQILRVELGPTTFNFYRFYMRAQVNKSGADTEMTWVLMQ